MKRVNAESNQNFRFLTLKCVKDFSFLYENILQSDYIGGVFAFLPSVPSKTTLSFLLHPFSPSLLPSLSSLYSVERIAHVSFNAFRLTLILMKMSILIPESDAIINLWLGANHIFFVPRLRPANAGFDDEKLD